MYALGWNETSSVKMRTSMSPSRSNSSSNTNGFVMFRYVPVTRRMRTPRDSASLNPPMILANPDSWRNDTAMSTDTALESESRIPSPINRVRFVYTEFGRLSMVPDSVTTI